MRGRMPSGPEFVDQVSGSVVAKNRARVLLETIAGTCRVKEACLRLGISEPRFDQLRIHGGQRRFCTPRRASIDGGIPCRGTARF